jgi:hypothetical protein
MRKLWVAYVLWCGTFLGLAGMHRYYLGRVGTGVLYTLSWGLFGVGTIVDFFRMQRLVDEANLRERYRGALDYGPADFSGWRRPVEGGTAIPLPRKKETPERVILKLARQNNGIATPAEVALEGELSLESAKKFLDQLAAKGFAELRVRKSGGLVYVFPDLMSDPGAAGLDEL